MGRQSTGSRDLVAVEAIGEVVEPSELRRLSIEIERVAEALQVVYTL